MGLGENIMKMGTELTVSGEDTIAIGAKLHLKCLTRFKKKNQCRSFITNQKNTERQIDNKKDESVAFEIRVQTGIFLCLIYMICTLSV